MRFCIGSVSNAIKFIKGLDLIASAINNAKFADDATQSIAIDARTGELRNLTFKTPYETCLRIYFGSRSPESISTGSYTIKSPRIYFLSNFTLKRVDHCSFIQHTLGRIQLTWHDNIPSLMKGIHPCAFYHIAEGIKTRTFKYYITWHPIA